MQRFVVVVVVVVVAVVEIVHKVHSEKYNKHELIQNRLTATQVKHAGVEVISVVVESTVTLNCERSRTAADVAAAIRWTYYRYFASRGGSVLYVASNCTPTP